MKERDYTLEDDYFNFNLYSSETTTRLEENLKDVMKKSLVDGIEGRKSLPTPNAKTSKKQNKDKVVEMSEEMARDLEVLKMRSAFDPKRFYKKDQSLAAHKQIQIGKVIDSPTEFYSSRVPKKLRKRTLVDELLADQEFKKYNKRKFVEIVEQRRKTHMKAYRYSKRLKKRK